MEDAMGGHVARMGEMRNACRFYRKTRREEIIWKT